MKASQCVQVYVIYKIDATYKHNYPLLNNVTTTLSNTADDSFTAEHILQHSTPQRTAAVSLTADNNTYPLNTSTAAAAAVIPFRTFSHYGFNCPLTNVPNILLHPANQSIWQTVAEQRERVVSFIDLTNLSFAKRKMLNVLSAGYGKQKQLKEQQQDSSAAQSYVSEMQIQLQATPRKQRNNSAATTATRSSSCSRRSSQSVDDSLDELTAQFGSMLNIISPDRHRDRDDDSLYPSSYTLRSFLPDNHALPKDGGADKPEAEQALYQNGDDSGLGGSNQSKNSNNSNNNSSNNNNNNKSGTRRRAATNNSNSNSNDSSTHEAEAYSQGKHIRLTLSSSPEAMTTTSSIEILINVSLRNTECVQTVQEHEQEFRAKLEKVIDDEIHYISQQLVMQQRTTQQQQQQQQLLPRAPLASPTPSSSVLLQRCNSAPALCHTYSYVAIADIQKESPPSGCPHSCPEAEALQRLLSTLEIELQHLLNSIIRAHELHNRAVIYDCRTRISQMREDIKGVVKRTRAK